MNIFNGAINTADGKYRLAIMPATKFIWTSYEIPHKRNWCTHDFVHRVSHRIMFGSIVTEKFKTTLSPGTPHFSRLIIKPNHEKWSMSILIACLTCSRWSLIIRMLSCWCFMWTSVKRVNWVSTKVYKVQRSWNTVGEKTYPTEVPKRCNTVHDVETEIILKFFPT